jgi:rRNA-processing protein FCF1
LNGLKEEDLPLVWRRLRVLLVLAVLTISGHSVALDHELADSPDFRVRVQAALRLGRGGPAGRADLEQGLKDPHPAVRVACAVGLGNIGDSGAIPALEAAMRAETYASAKQTMADQVEKLKRSGGGGGGASTALDKAKYVVQLGSLRNTSGVRSGDLDAVMRQAAKQKAGSIKDAVILDTSDTALLQKANAKQIPVIQLDGNLTRLTQSQGRDGGVIVSASVDLTIRKIPQQTLKGMVKGNASATGDSRTATHGLQELENRAVGGAIESAMNTVGSDIATLAK